MDRADDRTIVFSVPQEDLDATGRVILEAGRWCKTFYADGPWRPRGEWLPDNRNYYEERFVCSVCKRSYEVDTCMGEPMWDFCPHCGADMREEGQDE